MSKQFSLGDFKSEKKVKVKIKPKPIIDNKFTFIEMFSGIGGFRLGLERSGWKCVWANEIDKYASKIYNIHYGYGELDGGNIRNKGTGGIPEHMLLTAGFPCQAFSVAGKRKGFKDTRGTLFYEICRIAEAKRPTLLLLENVKGLLSHNEGLTFQIILESLEELGYWVEWQVLNSKHYEVPQKRERVFIVGHSRDRCTKQIFPIGEISQKLNGSCKKTQGKGSRIRVANPLSVGGSFKERNLIANTISKRYYKDGSENLLTFTCSSSGRGYIEKGRVDKRWQLSDVAQTLTAMQDKQRSGTYAIVGNRVRRLTPVECERLQGFPDGWTKWLSDTQRYKCLGNAVTVNVIEYLGKKLKECIQ